MLTRTMPFRGSSRSDWLRQLHLATPPPIAALRPEVPRGLVAIVAKALEKRPDDRYASMTEVLHALGQLDLAAVADPAHRTRARFRRLVAALTFAAVVLSLAWGGWFLYQRSTSGRVDTSRPEAPLSRSPYELTQRAAQLLQRQDRPENVESAIQALEAALTADQRYAPAYAYLADAYRRKNASNPDPQWTRLAAESARRALELNPDLALAHTSQGFVDFDAGRLADAEARWRRAIEMDPNAPMPHLGLGIGYAAQQRDQEAEASLKEAVRLRGSDWRFDSELGTFYIRRSRYADAAASYEAARSLAPDSQLVWRNLGAAYFQLERYEEAAGALQRALEIAPTAATYTNLGTLRFYQGRYHDAVPAFEKAVQLGTNRSLYWGNLADAYRWAPGRRADSFAAYERAISLLREEITRQPTVVDLRSRLATYLVKSNQTPVALDMIKDIEREPALTAQVQMHLTMVHELAGNRDRALHWLEQAIQGGFSAKEVANEPELTTLRADARYHRVVARPTR
jgi:tetratricopeptide (TPR) repeat protein